jgi:hypothetical protein
VDGRVVSSDMVRMRISFSAKRCAGNQNTHFIFNNFIFENRTIYEIKWKNGETWQATVDNKVLRIRTPGWIPKATNTHLECVIVIAFPQ